MMMARRPGILNGDYVKEGLRNVIRARDPNIDVDKSATAHASCLRWAIPMAIIDVGVEGLQRLYNELKGELKPRWEQQARDIVAWAKNEIERYKAPQ
jgi:hypothetical protein